MKKADFFSYSVGLSILILGTALMTEKALAQSENSAEIYSDFNCSVLNANRRGVVTDDSNSHRVVARQSGTTILKCTVKGVTNDTGEAVQFSDFPCRTPEGVTTDSRETISASGVATLTCMIHHD